VYDLRVLLGHPKAGTPRWLLVSAPPQVALAFDRFDGHLRVPRVAIASAEPSDARSPHLRETVRSEGLVRPIIGIASVLEAIETLARGRARPKE